MQHSQIVNKVVATLKTKLQFAKSAVFRFIDKKQHSLIKNFFENLRKPLVMEKN